MKHLFVPYHLAQLAKEKGFDERCFGRHNPMATFDHDKFHSKQQARDYVLNYGKKNVD